MDSLHSQNGFTLLEGLIAAILIAILASLVFGYLNAEQTAHARRCQTDITIIQSYERQWLASGDAGKRDNGLCKQLNDRVDQYNKTCGNDFGALAKVECK